MLYLGKDGSITYDPFYNTYYVEFKTYNMFSSDGYFEAPFTD